MKKYIPFLAIAIFILGVSIVWAVNTQTKTKVFQDGDMRVVVTYEEPVCTDSEPCPICNCTEPEPMPPIPTTVCESYCWHLNDTATVFWIGEPKGNGSSEDNAVSAYDGDWVNNYGGYDDYQCRDSYHPCGFTPKENPFYVTVPLENKNLKNKWVEVKKDGKSCFGQVEDAGPYVYNDKAYVWGCTSSPRNTRANSAGMDVSPALRDCLNFNGLNNADNKVDWKFVDEACVPDGAWTEIVTTSGYNW